MSEDQDRQFVEFVLKTIVDRPDDVKVERTVDEMGVLLTVTVHPEDMGKVIGKSGQTAKAIRSLLKVVGAKNDARVNMKIVEPDGGKGPNGGAAAVAGTTAAADDIPVQDRSEEEAAAEQQQTTADQPDNEVAMDSDIDDATGQPADAADDDAPEHREAVDQGLNEKSPLDEL
ncbi:MAG TPA: KH domain-containing protein [Patescibacteria group bacterium]|jgi:hypothetical protein